MIRRWCSMVLTEAAELTATQMKKCSLDEIKVKVFAVSEQSIYDGPGNRMVIFFQGCNVGCSWCHSPHSQPYKSPLLFYSDRCILCRRCQTACKNGVHEFIGEEHTLNRDKCIQCGKCIESCPRSAANKESGVLYLPTKTLTVSSLMQQILPYLALCDGVTVSGGEALLQTEGCIRFLMECKQRNIHTALETSGLLPQSLYSKANPYVDVWLWGVRVIVDKNRYSDLKIQEENAELLAGRAKEIIPRITVIPGLITEKEVLSRTLRILKALGQNAVWVNPWNKSYDVYYRACGLQPDFPEPSDEDIETAQSDLLQFLSQNGFKIINQTNLQ